MKRQKLNSVNYINGKFIGKNIKKRLFLVFLILSFIIIPLTFAGNNTEKTCITCSITPPQLNDFIKFSYEILSIIEKPKVSPEKQLQGPNGLFSQGALNTIDNPKNTNKTQKNMFKSLKKGLKNNAITVFQSLKTTTLVMGKLLNPKDLIAGIWTVIRYPYPIVRDYKKIIDLDDILSDRLFQLGTEGKFSKIVNIEQIGAIQEASKKYQGSGQKLFAQNGFIIKPSVTYGQIIKFLRVLNSKYKTFLTINKSSQFGNIDDIKKAGNNNISITFSPTLIQDLKNDYSCARSIFSKCKNSGKLFIENIKNILKTTKKNTLTSLMTFKTSMVRLQKAMQGAILRNKKKSTQCKRILKFYNQDGKTKSNIGRYYIDPDTNEKILYINNNGKRTSVILSEDKKSGKTIGIEKPTKESIVLTNCQFKTRDMGNDDKSKKEIEDFLNRENELLRTQYGIYIKNAEYDKSLIGRGLDLLKTNRSKQIKNNINNKIKTSESNISDKISNIFGKVKSFFDLGNNEQKRILKKILNTEYNISADKFTNIGNLYNDFYQSIYQSTTEHIINYNQTTLNDTTDITKAIGQMVQKIRFSTHMIKDKDNPNSLINNLGNACEGQCANQGGKCRSD